MGRREGQDRKDQTRCMDRDVWRDGEEGRTGRGTGIGGTGTGLDLSGVQEGGEDRAAAWLQHTGNHRHGEGRLGPAEDRCTRVNCGEAFAGEGKASNVSPDELLRMG